MATGRVPTTANSPLTAKGDLFGYSTTQARVAVGNNGETLVADSSTSTGLRYQGSITAGKNFAINGGYDIWQRGTSFSGANAYNADRWYVTPFNATVSRQSSGAPVGSQYYSRTTATSSSAYANQFMLFETAQIAPLWGNTVTVTIKVRRNATMNANLAMNLFKSATVDAGTGATWTTMSASSGVTTLSNASITTGTGANDWSVMSAQYAIPNDGTANSLRFVIGESVSLNSGSIWDNAQFQIELGSVATTFSRAGGTIQGELAACQRYCEKIGPGAYQLYGTGQNGSTTTGRAFVPFRVPKRAGPSISFGTTAAFEVSNASFTGVALTAISTIAADTVGAWIGYTVASGLVAGNATMLLDGGLATTFILLSSEL